MQTARAYLLVMSLAMLTSTILPINAAEIFDQTPTQLYKESKPLQGGVQHSEVLPSLIEDLRPGKAYSTPA